LAIAVAMAGTTQAAMIGINLTGFQVQYVTGANRANDLQSEMGGNQNPAQAVSLSGAEFMVDDALIAQYSKMNGEYTYADMLLNNISPDLFLPASVANPSVAEASNGGGFGFEWFYDDGGTMRSLLLNIDRASLVLLRNPLNALKPTLVITG